MNNGGPRSRIGLLSRNGNMVGLVPLILLILLLVVKLRLMLPNRLLISTPFPTLFRVVAFRLLGRLGGRLFPRRRSPWVVGCLVRRRVLTPFGLLVACRNGSGVTLALILMLRRGR